MDTTLSICYGRPLQPERHFRLIASTDSYVKHIKWGRAKNWLAIQEYGASDISWSLFNLRECSNEKIAFTSLMVLEARNGLTGYSG
jgi:hypothetical protein